MLLATSILLLMVVTTIALQTPAVQTRIINYLTTYLSQKTGYQVSINEISIQWFDKFTAGDVEIHDPEGNLMISADDLLMDYDLRALYGSSTKVIDFVEINEAQVNARIITYDDTVQNLNLTEFINRLRDLNKKTTGTKPQVVIERVDLKNSAFTYMDYRKDTLIAGFNYNKFTIENINASVDELYTHADTLQMQIREFSAHEPDNDLPISEITGEFRLSRKAMEFNDIEIHIGKSIIRDTVVLTYESTQDLRYFGDKVKMNANFSRAYIHTDDLSLFVPGMETLNDRYRLSGIFEGTIKNFSLTGATLNLGRGTELKGTIRMEGLPNIEETFMNYKLKDSYVLIDDLKPYLKEATIDRLMPLHHLNLNGQLIGFVNDFVAKGVFSTRLGRIESDINLKLTEDVNNSIYEGNLALYEFQLGKYASNPELDKVTLNGRIKGRGLTTENADFTLQGTVEKMDFRKYTYRNITTNGQFKNLFFRGKLESKDPNAQITLSGSIDLKKGEEKFQLSTNIKSLNLKPLNLSAKDISLTGKAVVNATGLEVDSILGEGVISDALVKVDKKSLRIDSLSFSSHKTAQERQILINSDLLDLSLAGNFAPTEAFKNIKLLLKEYEMAIDNNNEVIDQYYLEKKESVTDNYKVNYQLQIKDFNPFLNLIHDSIYVASGSMVKGELTGGYTSILTLDMRSDSIRYRKNAIKKASSEISVSKVADSKDILAMVYLHSEEQEIGSVLRTEDLQFESIWSNDHIDFDFFLKQQNASNYTDIHGNIDFAKDTIYVKFSDSDIQLFEKNWQIPQNNLITFSPGEINFKQLEIIQDHQKVAVNGKMSRTPGNSLNIKVDSVELYNLNPILRKPINGLVNAHIMIGDVYEDRKVNIIGAVRNFEVDEIPIGNVSGSSFYHNNRGESDITLVVERDNFLTATVQGTYRPRAKKDQLSLNAKVNKAPLNILEPFLESYFTSFRGTTSGDFKLTGTFLQPIFEGNGIIEDAGLHINYLNTSYSLNGDYSLAKNQILFNEIAIRDSENHAGSLTGTISHDFFNRFALDLSGNVTNFLLLNTTAKDNDLFYGTGYGSGSVTFRGPVNNLIIDAQARTEAGTRIFIPIGETGDIQTEEYINFVSFSDSTSIDNEPLNRIADLTGLNLNLALDVTPDAYTEIIFDIKSGDIIRGRGEGDLQLQIAPTGEFNMFGDFYIHQGGYNFTLYNIVNKEFQILPNSRISWYGDPYGGQMDIKASYEQLASLQPIITQANEIEDAKSLPREITRKYPTRVLMNLNGPLLTPAIDFNIEVEELPNYQVLVNNNPVEMNFLFSTFKDSWDEQELNRQVFSLIVLRKFSPLQSFSTGGTIASSVSELLSNQLSYWITQVNENLEIDVDFGSLDEEAFNTFQLRLAYTMLDGRLRIIRDGGVTTNTGNDKSTSTSVPYIGDWTVEYLLTENGQLRVKMYNRMNYNTLDVSNQNNVLTTGFSIQHIQSFDELRELFKKSRKKEKEKQDSVFNHSDAKLNDDEVL